jgi:hypothetical protein
MVVDGRALAPLTSLPYKPEGELDRPLVKRVEALVFASIVAAALASRLAIVFVTPVFQAPDERAHFRYVQSLVESRQLPVQPELDLAEAARFWPQYYQPPLAYLLLAPVFAIAKASGGEQETQVLALRAANAVLGAAIVALGYLVVARLTPPGDPRRALTALVLAFFPGFAANASAVTNDTLATLLATVLWLPLLRGGKRDPWLTGAALGAASLAKLTALTLAPLVLLVPLLQRRENALRRGAVAAGVAGAILLPWMLRNALVYGDPLAIGSGSISFRSLEALLPADALEGAARARPSRVLLTFLGQFGVHSNVGWVAIPTLLAPLFGLALVGWLRHRGRDGRDALERAAGAFAVAVLLAALGLVYFSLRYYGGWQGRYLYVAMLPVAALLAQGWARVIAPRRQVVFAALLAAALLALDAGILSRLHGHFSSTSRASWGLEAEL